MRRMFLRQTQKGIYTWGLKVGKGCTQSSKRMKGGSSHQQELITTCLLFSGTK